MRKPAVVAFATILLTSSAHADCLADLKSVFDRSLSGGPYLMQLVANDGTAMTTEAVPPASFHSKTSIEGATQEMTVVDGKGWIRLGGSWEPMPDDLAAQLTAGLASAIGAIDQVVGSQCLGAQVFEGRDYVGFRYDFALPPAAGSSTLYVDPETGLPAIVISTATVDGKTTNTRTTFRYDPGITVSAPLAD
jgi:hypothetical protein